MKKIIIVGSINTDLVISAPYMPEKGETLTGGGFFTAHGGKGANQAVAAARLGGKVIMCGCVGDDEFGKNAVSSLAADGIDVSHIRTVTGVPTGTAVIIVVKGDNRIILDKGANAHLSEADIDGALSVAEEGDIYLTQLENPVSVIGYGLKKAKEKGLKVILNPAPADVSVKPYLRYCDMVTPNETELELLGGRAELLACAENVITTLGGDGYEISRGKESEKYPCIKVEPVDTTAAGDTLCGGMAARLAAGDTLEAAVRYGSMAASVACTRKGAQPSIPTPDEISKYVG